MEVIITNHIKGIKLTLSNEQIQNLTDSEPFTKTLTQEQNEAVRKKFPRTNPNDLVIKANTENKSTVILWVYRPKAAYCNHTIKVS